jgi:hypothetical protein
VAAVRKGLRRGRKGGALEQARLHSDRQPCRDECRARDFLQAQAAIGARNRETPVAERDVGFPRFEQVRGNAPSLRDDAIGGAPQRAAAERHRARAEGAGAERDQARVAFLVTDRRGQKSQALAGDLAEHGFVALAMALGAE